MTASHGRKIVRQFTAFVGVGTVGFVVDAGVFALLHGFCDWTIFWARAASTICAITTTWKLNRQLTFSDRRSEDRAGEYLRYSATQAAGLAVNLVTFSLCLMAFPVLRQFPIFALVIGSAVALPFNFFTARAVAFRPRTRAANDSPRSR